MKTKLFSLLCTLMCAGNLFAYDFYVNGIYYNKLGGDSVYVTYETTSYNSYSGSVSIPEIVTYSNTTYRVTRIGGSAFYKCSGLTSVTIPNSVTTIGERAFYDCSRLKKTNYTGTIASWCKIKFGNRSSNPVCYSHNFFINDVEVKDLVIPEGVESIGECAFQGCSGLTSVTIPNSVTTIGNYTFCGCIGLTSVTIPNSVTTIGNYTFCGCDGLTSVTIPNSVTTIGNYAFNECFGLTKTNYTGTIADWCKIKFGNSSSNPMYCSHHHFFINDVEVKELVIPEGVDTIGNYAFCNCRGLTSVTIGNSVTTIGNNAFHGCFGLTSVTIGNSVTTIGEGAFAWCTSLTSIIVDAANTHYCSVDGVLFNYTKDTLIQYPIGNTRTEYTIPNSVTTIGNFAFFYCSGLTSVTIPNSVTTIGSSAFYDCDGLTSVTIPNSVTKIGEDAFAWCTSLTSVTCYATTPPTCGSGCFYNVKKSIPVYVPARSVDDYKQADIWREFTNILPISAEIVPSTDEIITQPSTNNVTITWPANDNASEYKLVIIKDGIVFCTLTFNAQGQLTGIAFAPNRAGSRMLDAAVMTANGWQFTVTGLDQASKYGYALDALNASKQSIKHYEGEFATDGYTSLEWVTSDHIQGINKMLLDGHLYILRDGNLFTATGARVK